MSEHGGSAFPEIETDMYYDRDAGKHYPHTHSHGGMTLRDYFAGQALMGMLCSMANPLCYQAGLEKARRADIPLHDGLAISAYAHADAMLKQRSSGDVGEA